jgi:hypothetical protein
MLKVPVLCKKAQFCNTFPSPKCNPNAVKMGRKWRRANGNLATIKTIKNSFKAVKFNRKSNQKSVESSTDFVFIFGCFRINLFRH